MGSLCRGFLSPAAFVDSLAAQVPHNVWVKAPVSPSQGPVTWQDITWLQLQRAVHFMARWMEQELGAGNGDEPVAYAGVNDARYPIVIMAALKSGYKSFLVSPRNSRESNLALLRATQCTKFMFSPELCGLADGLATEAHLSRTLQVPELHDLLAVSDDNHYESCVSGHLRDHETVMILHSSGTTGLPKPVYLKAGLFRAAAESISMPAPDGRRNVHCELYGTRLLLTTTPFFHTYGIILFVRSIYHQGPLALLPAGQSPTADLLLSAISDVQPTAVACPPSILEDVCSLPSGLNRLSAVDAIFYGGAPLARSCGDKISQITALVNGIGSTEAFNFPSLMLDDPADWEYFEWNPNVGIVMERTEESQLAELVVHREPGNEYQTVFHNFPDAIEWRTNDLYEQHPTKPALWKYVGRADDIIVLSNGEKTTPVPFEKAIEGHPWVRGALTVGTGRFQTGLILEPHSEQAQLDKDKFLNEVWPWVEDANAHCPTHTRVWRSMVFLATAEKPFRRAPKGSIVRNATYQLYNEEINLLYDRAGLRNGSAESLGHDISQIPDIIRKAVHSVLGACKKSITDDSDLFGLGIDSLQVMHLRQILYHDGIACTARMVYKNPSIKLLSQAVGAGQGNSCTCNNVSREEKMSAMVHRYTKFGPESPRAVSTNRENSCVLLVGSTGALKTHLLHELLKNPGVKRVYCLNRSVDAAERQIQAFADRGLPTDDVMAHPKVRFLTGETSKENFGLDQTDYEELNQHVDMIVLNGWPVNFNSTLESFEGVIAGTKRCVDFAAASSRRLHIAFVSSVASVLNFPSVRGRDDKEPLSVPEEFDPDNSLPAKQGYGESKHVASSILAKAAQDGVIEATILRVGQLAGTLEGKGVWNRHEWLPSLIKTAKSLGKIPRSLGPAHDAVGWVPVDIAARIIIELVALGLPRKQNEAAVACYNVVNPHTTDWSQLAAVVQEFYAEKGQPLTGVRFDEWLDELNAVGGEKAADHVDDYPALKLLDFFEGMRVDGAKGHWGYATRNGSGQSAAMDVLEPVNGTLMRKWLGEWMF